MTGRPTVMTLVLRPDEHDPVRRALLASLRRGPVEYDPTQVRRALTGLSGPLPLSLPAVHALREVMCWTNSAGQKKRWDKTDLRALQDVRARLAALTSDEADQVTADTLF